MTDAILMDSQPAVGEPSRVPAEPSGVRRGASAERPALWLSRLTVSDFRCYGRAQLDVDSRPLVLAGPNGAGKTNLLEAVSFLAPGRGLRRARLGDIDRRRPAGGTAGAAWAVASRIETPEGPRDVGTGRDPGAAADLDAPALGDGVGRERRLVKIDGAFVRGQQALAEIATVVWLTPQMDGLFREGAASRRRFLDRLVYGFDPAHAGRIAGYEYALRERARLLRSGSGDRAWLVALEETMAGRAVAIAAARRDLVARLVGACAADMGPFPRPGLGLKGDIEAWLDEMPALAAEEALRARLEDDRSRDALTGGAAAGPHRSDLVVTHRQKGLPAELCSTGEQKALLVSIVLAHARLLRLDRGAPPLILLDEVAAHLDDRRRAVLFETVLALGAQAWLTGTDAELFAPLGEAAQFFEVRDARVIPAPRPQ